MNLLVALLASLSSPALMSIDNGEISVTIDLRSGLSSIDWGNRGSVGSFLGEARLDGNVVTTAQALRHVATKRRIRDKFGEGTELTVRHEFKTGPSLVQTFWVYGHRPEVITQLEVSDPNGTATNYLAPIVADRPQFAHKAETRALFVPWDNDMYFRFRSDGWGEGAGDGDGSYEVGAVYDDSTRHGLIVGSLDHELWKSAVRFKRDGKGGLDSLRAYAGVVSKYTHDTQPHGTVSGKVVRSPRMVVGWYPDWRAGLERFGDLNAIVRPALPWAGSVPFGWNSWSGHKSKVTAEAATAAADFIHDQVPLLRSGGTATINFDAGGGNLSPEQMSRFIAHAHSMGFKAGIYATPFACWSSLDKKVDETEVLWRDLVLKDDKGNPLPKLDGAYPLDPSDPRVLKRIDEATSSWVAKGFDYVKLDFLSHGNQEGHHADFLAPTGTAAYSMGMQRIVDDLSPKKIGRPFFISLSIAPMFPYGFAHSRRISCDIFANIGASEYLLNSTNYGWWPGGRLYRFNDADSVCVYQPKDEPAVTEAEARTRFTASAISGGMMIQGDDLLDKPQARERVKRLFANRAILDLARKTPNFRPVNGATGYAAGDSFEWREGRDLYVAVFNFDKLKSKHLELTLARLGIVKKRYRGLDLWTQRTLDGRDRLVFDLPPMDCSLIKITPW